MPRPETYRDLSDYDRQGTAVVEIMMTNIPADGSLLASLGTFVTALNMAGLTVNQTYGRISAYLPPTTDELDAALLNAQESWDSAKELYDSCESKPEDNYQARKITNYAKKEGLPLPW